MDGSADQPALVAQRAAILEARTRYERGELTYDAFRRALDALVLARDAADCQAVLDALPVSPLAALAALDTPPPPLVPAPVAPPDYKRIVAFMSQIKKMHRPWQLATHTHAVAFMGEIKLDLRLAELPPQATLHINAVMGTAIIYIPRSVAVAVHTTVIMGETNALGERIGGLVVTGQEEHVPTLAPGTPTARIDIEATNVMGTVKVVLTDGQSNMTIGELVRSALRAIAAGARQGLREGARQYPSLPAASDWDEGPATGR